MSIETLTHYLRYSRRAEEAEAKSKYRLAQVIDKSYNPNLPPHEEDMLLVNKEDIKQQNGFKNISNLIAGNLYFTISNNNHYTYYIKREREVNGSIIKEYSQITSIITNVWETRNENDLNEVIFSDASILYYSETLQKIIILFLNDALIFGDTLKYHPNDSSEVTNGTYTLDYKDANGFTTSFLDRSQKVIGNANKSFSGFLLEIFKSEARRLLYVIKNNKPGIVHLFPSITEKQNKYYLQYKYYAKGIPQQTFILDTAITLEFNYIGAMMAFLNQTLFYTLNELSHFEGSKNREAFLNAYRNIIQSHIYNGNFTEVMEVLFFAPSFLVKEIHTEYLWQIIDTILSERITNFEGIDKEDIVLKLLEVLASKQGYENKILEQLLAKHRSGETRFTLLYNGMNGENFVKFTSLINRIWKKSKFIEPNLKANPEFKTTTGPLFLPYESEKWLGLYFSNASTSLKDGMVKVNFETGKSQEVQRPNPKGGGDYTTKEEIIEQYDYHPFYPIFIKNIEKQETTLELDAIVPAFMLLTNQNKQFWSNVLKTGEYTLDVATTLSGIGNLAKFRNLAKLGQAGSIIAKVKLTAGIVEVTSGVTNTLLKITGFEDTELGKSLQEYLFWLEILSLSGELTVAIKEGLQKSAKEVLTNKEELIKNLEEQGIDDITKRKILNEINQIANVKTSDNLLNDFIELRAKYFNTSATVFNKLIKESLELNHLGKTELFSLYTRHLKQFPNLAKGHNQAIFKIKFFENGKIFDEVEEFSLSGDLDKMVKNFGNPPKFPPNTVNVLNDFKEFETFVTGAYDLFGRSRKFDSEIKFIYNFIKNHAHKADEFIIETSNIFKTCGSCSREFVLLKQLLENQGKELKIIVKADEEIDGTKALFKKYPELKKMK